VIPILSVVGRSKSGKTTLLEKLIREFTTRGRRIGTIKHHYHGSVTVDVPGKDSWRHRQAGARAVALLSPETLFLVRDSADGLSVETIAHLGMWGVDLVLTEGFKASAMPKIEINRRVQGVPLLCGPVDGLVAVVSDWATGASVPHFGLEDTAPLADFIAERYPLGPGRLGVEVLVGGRRVALDARTEAALVRAVRGVLAPADDPTGGLPVELRIPGQVS